MEFSKFLRDNRIFAQAIRYPTVKKDQARIRISITGWLSNKEIEHSMQILEKAKRKFKLKSIIVKNFEGTTGKRGQDKLWRYRALMGGFYIFKHEYILLFQKL